MITEPSPSEPTAEEISEAKTRVILGIYDLERALARVLDEKHTLQDYLGFCDVLRQCKLRYFQNDRQEPGAFDDGVRFLIQCAQHFLLVTSEHRPADPAVAVALARVREGVKNTHIRDLQERLDTKPAERCLLDKKKFGADWDPIREVRWDKFEPRTGTND